jgi:tetratricopeptide (TPR) repeat protein
MAMIKGSFEHDLYGAEREARAAIVGNPNYPRARQALTEVLSAQERFDEALAEIKRGVELDPLALYMNAAVAMALYYARRSIRPSHRHRQPSTWSPSIPRISSWGWHISRPVGDPTQSGRFNVRAHCPSGAR